MMFNLNALLNSFGKDFYKYVGDETLKKDLDLYKFLESAFRGDFRLGSKPEFLNTDNRKTINIENDNCEIGIAAIDEDNDRIIFVDCTYRNAEKITFALQANASGIVFNGVGFNALFELTDNNKVVYYGADNIKACRKLVGKNDIDNSRYLSGCLIEPNAEVDISVSDEDFESNLGTFVKEHANQNFDSSFHLDSFINKITSDIFNNVENVKPFKAATFIDNIYGDVKLPIDLNTPAFSGWSLDHSDTESLILAGKNKDSDAIKISYSAGVVGDNTLEISINSGDYKITTSIVVNDGNVSYVSRLVNNCPNDGMSVTEVCSIIAGDLNSARYYGNETIDIYSKLKELAFKMEIVDDKDFSDFFVEPDEVLEIDPGLSLDIQLAGFINSVFFKNDLTKKDENVLSLNK